MQYFALPTDEFRIARAGFPIPDSGFPINLRVPDSGKSESNQGEGIVETG